MSTDKMKIIVDVDGAKKGSAEFDRMRVKTEGVERAVGQLRNKLLLFTFATAAVVGVVTKLTKASIEQEKIFNSLENAVNITGANYDGLKGSLDGYFASLQQSTIYGDTDTAQVLQQLTMLTGDYEGSIKALPYVLDLASSGMTDLGGATRYIGMGMSGNIEMLGRYIPEFKAATNETLKNMGATEKAAYMFDVLKEKVGGLAEKELNTTAGKWKQFKNYWGDLNEAIGDKLSPTLKKAAEHGTAFIQSLTETSLETTIRELEELGVSSKEILELKKFSWNVQLEDINAELKKAGVNYENIKDVTAEIKTLKEKDIAYTKAKARIQTEEITKISQIEDIYASIGASVEDYGRLHRNYNSYLSNSETELEAINMLEGLVLSTLMDDTKEIKNQKKELAEYSGLLIDREKLERQISGELVANTKTYKTSIVMLTDEMKKQVEIQEENIKKWQEIWGAQEEGDKKFKTSIRMVTEEVEELGELQKNMMQMTSNAMADIMVNAFDDGFDKIGEMFTRLLMRMLEEFLATQLMKLFINIATSGLGNLGSKITPTDVALSVPSSPNLPSVPNTQPITSVSPSTGGATLDDVVIALGNMVVLSDVETARFVERGEAKRIY